jgi:hypothetical protein
MFLEMRDQYGNGPKAREVEIRSVENGHGGAVYVTRITVKPSRARHSPLTSTATSTTGSGTMIDNHHELTMGELDAVNGGFLREIIARIVAGKNAQEDKKQADALKGFQQALQELP